MSSSATRNRLVATSSQTVGPFFHLGLTATPNGRLIDQLPPGEEIALVIKVVDGNGEPVGDAMLELWQSGAFGRMPTGPDGTCEFRTSRPASHINVCLFARGLLRQLHTRIYFAGAPTLADDPVLALVPPSRRDTLLAIPDRERAGTWRFDVRLQGTRETVFFDL